MLLPTSVRIFLASTPCDMRRSFDGLAAQVAQFGQNVYDGHLFVFVSKRRNRCKILSWQAGGFVLWYKRLEKGTFKLPQIEKGDTVLLDPTSLAMLVDGIDTKKVPRPVLWRPKKVAKDRHADQNMIKELHERTRVPGENSAVGVDK